MMKAASATLLLALCPTGAVRGEPRDVQIASIDFVDGVLELANLGDTDQPLDGWRFCSHEGDHVRRHSNNGALNGLTLEPGSSLFVHFLNDAPSGDPDRIDIAGRGAFALPLYRVVAKAAG